MATAQALLDGRIIVQRLAKASAGGGGRRLLKIGRWLPDRWAAYAAHSNPQDGGGKKRESVPVGILASSS